MQYQIINVLQGHSGLITLQRDLRNCKDTQLNQKQLKDIMANKLLQEQQHACVTSHHRQSLDVVQSFVFRAARQGKLYEDTNKCSCNCTR